MIQVLNRAINILEYVAENVNKPKLLGHIAKDLNLNTATCANIVKTLVSRGLLRKPSNQKGYLVGSRLSEIANGTLGFNELLLTAEDLSAEVLIQLNENCSVAILKNDKRQIIFNKLCNHAVQATTLAEKSAYDSSTGRVLIAFLSDVEIQLFIKRYGLPKKKVWEKAASRMGLLSQIVQIRENGYCLIEDSVQVVGIAVPIFQNKKVVASFSIYLPSFRYKASTKLKMIELAKRIGQSSLWDN